MYLRIRMNLDPYFVELTLSSTTFRKLVETLYCIVNILYNAMKETKRTSEALRKLVFPFGVSRVNLRVFVCECDCVMSHFA